MSESDTAAGLSASSGGGDKKGTGIDNDCSFKLLPVLPILLEAKVLTLEDCLKFRLVCGKWKQGVDSVLQNDPSRLNLPEESRAFSLRVGAAVAPERERLFNDFGMNIWGRWFFFLSDHHVNWSTDRYFVDQLLAHPTNPFVGRSLNLRVNHWVDYYDLGRRLLSRFGDELWYFSFRIDDENTSVDECNVKSRIRDALLHLPNLKWLQLDVSLPHDENESTLETRVRQYFKRYPLSKLQHLETFSCDGMFQTPKIILTSILESCAVAENLKRLDVSNSELKYSSSLLFPNLEEIGIKMDLKDVGSLKDTSPRLRKISLVVINPAEDGKLEDIECVQLFGALEAFQETLIDLGIGRELQEVSYTIRWNADFRIHLPKLESFELFFDILPECLENLGSLKHLGVVSFSEEEQIESFKLKVERLVPSLKTFKCNGVLSKIKRKLAPADQKRSSKFGEWVTCLMNAFRSYF